MLRPYNIFTDMDLCGEPTSFEVELDSWGTVLIAYANTESNHSIPTNRKGANYGYVSC